MKEFALFVYLFSSAIIAQANSIYFQNVDTVNVEVKYDNACPGAVINFKIINKSATPLDSIWWKGDYDSTSNNYYWDSRGLASSLNISQPNWIFYSNGGEGKFPFTVKVKNILGLYKTYFDTVEIGEPFINIINDPATCCGFNDTIYADVRFLTKPYNTIQWIDNATSSTSPALLINKDKLPVSILFGRSNIDLKLVIEDSKGCRGIAIKYFNLTTDLKLYKNKSINIHPNPATNKIFIQGLSNIISNNARIFTIQGQLLKSIDKIDNNEIDLSEFNPGVYLIKINDVAHRVVKL